MANAAVITLKLLINTQTRKVLFAEAGKDSVDFLFYILSLPVAKVISLVGKQGIVGSLANLYESVENLNETYMQPNQTKNTLLKPHSPLSTCSGVPLLAIDDAPALKKFYTCDYFSDRGPCYGEDCYHSYPERDLCSDYVSDDPRSTCPNCNKKMTFEMSYVSPPGEQRVSTGEGGFVKGVVTYMVMDDLVVKPMSTISSFSTMLNKFNINNVGILEEKVVDFGMDKAVKLLKACLETKNVLTHVFLGQDS